MRWQDRLDRLRDEQRPPQERPFLQLPAPQPPPDWMGEQERKRQERDDDEAPRGVIIIEL